MYHGEVCIHAVSISEFIHTHTHTHTHTHIYIYIYLHTYTHIHTYRVKHKHVHQYVHIHVHILIHTHKYTLLHTYKFIYRYKHIHIHTYTRSGCSLLILENIAILHSKQITLCIIYISRLNINITNILSNTVSFFFFKCLEYENGQIMKLLFYDLYLIESSVKSPDQ